ncbi:hypothetical protein ACFL03_13765 [Thermodesulfobacteriota bacterium]
MTEENPKDNTKAHYVRIPANLFVRVKAFASENNYKIEGVVIEAIDVFLREQKKTKQ